MASTSTLTIISLNILGVPFTRPSAQLRTAKMCEILGTASVDILNLQEVHTYRLLHSLRGGLPSLLYVSFKRGLIGPAGGLATFSRYPIERRVFHPMIDAAQNVQSKASLMPGGKGMLVSHFAGIPLVGVNLHLHPNKDGDWSEGNRHTPLHRAQLAEVSRIIDELRARHDKLILVSGDFNLARDSVLYDNFVVESALRNAFGQDDTPTYHAEFLAEGQPAHCIDYVFTAGRPERGIVTEASLIFKEKVSLRGNDASFYISDHIGLRVKLTYA